MDAGGKSTVLFLCTGNSCRSQMAEGFLRAWAGERFEVYSAGLEPKAEVHPRAIEVMREVGVSIVGQVPKSVDEYLGRVAINHAIIVCERAEKKCPTLYPMATQMHFWPFDDPANFDGPVDETLEQFRAVRDQIGARIQKWLSADVSTQ